MDKQTAIKFERLKKDYLDMERVTHDEKECLLKIINTFGIVMAMHTELAEEYDEVKKLVDIDTDKVLPMNQIEKLIGKLKSRIFLSEVKAEPEQDLQEKENEPNERLLKMCGMIQHIATVLLDDFYPVTDELKEKANDIDINWNVEMEGTKLEKATTSFPSYLRGLKTKIYKDFRDIHNTLIIFLEHVKELEKTLMNEFDGDARQTEFEEFEMKVANEVGSIVDSFNIHKTIDEIKRNVLEKLKKIKKIVSIRKEKEQKKFRSAQKNIARLKKKISKAEKDAMAMTKRAKYFKKAATKDGLTGLNNRYAFDTTIKDAQNVFNEGGGSFTLGLFDVDNFKWINDTFGHVSGDKILKRVAQCLQETFRKNDFIARIGGDEFAVIIEELSEEMARERVLIFTENFRKKKFFSQNKGNIEVTISAGVAKLSAGERLEDLINRADMDMYASKKMRKLAAVETSNKKN